MTRELWQLDFANKLKYYLKEQNMTQSQLASYTGLSKSRISDYINMTAIPTIFSLIAISNAFGIPVADLAVFDEIID